MNLDVNLGNVLTLAVIVVGFAIWSKTTVAVLATRVDQHDRDVAGLKKWQLEQDERFGRGIEDLRRELGEVRERLVRIEALLERAVGERERA